MKAWRTGLPFERVWVRCGGYSFAEVVAAIGVFGVIVGIGAPHFNPRRLLLSGSHRLVVAQLRLARTAAITKSTHMLVDFPSSSTMRVGQMQLLGGVWRVDETMRRTLDLSAGTQIAEADVGTSIEFNSRGEASNLNAAHRIDMLDAYGTAKIVEVWPSGQIDEP